MLTMKPNTNKKKVPLMLINIKRIKVKLLKGQFKKTNSFLKKILKILEANTMMAISI